MESKRRRQRTEYWCFDCQTCGASFDTSQAVASHEKTCQRNQQGRSHSATAEREGADRQRSIIAVTNFRGIVDRVRDRLMIEWMVRTIHMHTLTHDM